MYRDFCGRGTEEVHLRTDKTTTDLGLQRNDYVHCDLDGKLRNHTELRGITREFDRIVTSCCGVGFPRVNRHPIDNTFFLRSSVQKYTTELNQNIDGASKRTCSAHDCCVRKSNEANHSNRWRGWIRSGLDCLDGRPPFLTRSRVRIVETSHAHIQNIAKWKVRYNSRQPHCCYNVRTDACAANGMLHFIISPSRCCSGCFPRDCYRILVRNGSS